MLYIVKVYKDGQMYEYKYGLLEHAREHLKFENSYAELYVWLDGREEFMEAVNSNT